MAIDLTDVQIKWEIESLHKDIVNQNKQIIVLLLAIKELLEQQQEKNND